uniref:Ig-like domain-containing protein n=1 Tax=Sparus aurata TaxID=8175 RepID=A0A671UJ10_SPAAU
GVRRSSLGLLPMQLAAPHSLLGPEGGTLKACSPVGEVERSPLRSEVGRVEGIEVSEGGVYWCRGGRGEPVYYTEYSDSVTIYKISEFDCCTGNRTKTYVVLLTEQNCMFDVDLTFLHFCFLSAVVTLQPNWTEVYRGERITLRCEIKDGGDTEWEYEWRTTSSEKPSDQNEHSITSVTGSHSGDYRCKGRKKHTQHSSTDWSDPIKLTVSDSKSHHISFKVKIIQLIKILLVWMLQLFFCLQQLESLGCLSF